MQQDARGSAEKEGEGEADEKQKPAKKGKTGEQEASNVPHAKKDTAAESSDTDSADKVLYQLMRHLPFAQQTIFPEISK